MKKESFLILLFLLAGIAGGLCPAPPVYGQNTAVSHIVQPGETWAALAAQTNSTTTALQLLNPHINTQRQPAVGSTISLPGKATRTGQLIRPIQGGLLTLAAAHNLSPWKMALQNNLAHPYIPLLLHPIILPDSKPVYELPAGFATLSLSQIPARPGQALGVRGVLSRETAVTTSLGSHPFPMFTNGRFAIGLTAEGAFFGNAAPELLIHPAGKAAWVQPWLFVDDTPWTFQQITLTGSAAQIDQTSIQQERERLFAIWQQATPAPLFNGRFQLPIASFLEISSAYGARRSYNGGPYRTYHEGVDFSAYGGTAVLAPAAGTIVVAETLYVRGGTVIIDHGLGIYSGFYHMNTIHVTPGETVSPGQIVGEVGTTGLSTGNHLHWDLLINGVWVDGQAWLDQEMGCWVLAGWNGRDTCHSTQ
ncbi:MAG: hypothetical protein Kow0080_18710 [Candidatus Promineifilaceae bacterium]